MEMNCQPCRMSGQHSEVVDDGRRPIVPGPPKVEGPLPGFLHGPGGRVMSVPERYWPGSTVVEHPASGGTPTLLDIIPKDVEVSGVPCRGLQGTDIETHQPTDSIRCFI